MYHHNLFLFLPKHFLLDLHEISSIKNKNEYGFFFLRVLYNFIFIFPYSMI